MGIGYASKKKQDRLESELVNLRSAVEAQTQLIVEMRDALMPAPVNIMYGRQQSPAVRQVGISG